MIYIKIIDDKDKEVEIGDLTDTGIEMAIYDCKQILKQLEDELYKRKN